MSLIGTVLGLLVPRLRSPGQPPQDGAALYFATLGSRLRYLLYDGTERWVVDSSHRGAQGGVAPMAVVAATAPTTGDDSADGYVVGQNWIDTSAGTPYVCTDNTAGAAVWLALTGAGGLLAVATAQIAEQVIGVDLSGVGVGTLV